MTTASDPMGEADFGISVAISGDTVVVGADDDDDERDAGGPDNWGQVKKLNASDAGPGDFFGTAVAIDGDRIVVAAIGTDVGGANSGSAYVFERNAGGSGSWGQVKKLTAADAATQDLFGGSVSISGDTLVVGAYTDDSPLGDSGSAYVFERNAGGCGQLGPSTAADRRGSCRGRPLWNRGVDQRGHGRRRGGLGRSGRLASGSAYVFRLVCPCGDGFVEPPEQCDDGIENSDTTPDACRTDCTVARCGDGVEDTGETCDDGTPVRACRARPAPVAICKPLEAPGRAST